MLKRTILIAVALTLAHHATAADAPSSPQPASQPDVFDVTPVATGIRHGWGFVFLPDNRILLTERDGNMRFVGSDGALSEPLQGLPPIAARGPGRFARCHAQSRFREGSPRLFFVLRTRSRRRRHRRRARPAGSFVAGERAGHLAPATEGRRRQSLRLAHRVRRRRHVVRHDGRSLRQREKVQDMRTTIGKVVRINADGTAPRDNPFVGRPVRRRKSGRRSSQRAGRRHCIRKRASCGRRARRARR